MGRRLLQVVTFITAWLLAGASIHAQQTPCPSPSVHDERPPGPDISIVEVNFSGSLQMPGSDQAQIADSIKQATHGTSLDGVLDEALERARAGWQDRGYFKVHVGGETSTLTNSPANQRIALSIHVDEGARYSLSEITFKNNKGISNVGTLRDLFPIQDGDIFSREKIATGLENLRKAYGEFGYINFTSVPDTNFDDENKLASLVMDFDEGKQFRVGSVKVLGLDESARQELLKTLSIKPGQVFSSRLWEESLLDYASLFPDCDCHNHERLRLGKRSREGKTIEERTGMVTLTFDFRPCPAN